MSPSIQRKEGNKQGGLAWEAQKGQARETLIDDVAFNGAALAKESTSTHRLLFATPTLKQEIHLSGYPKMHIKLACNKPATNLSVYLVSLPWNEDSDARITDNLITRGWADPQNYRSSPKVNHSFPTSTMK